MECFYGIGRANLTFAEIAQLMGLKRERVRQIRKRAVRRMYQQGRLGSSMKAYLKNARGEAGFPLCRVFRFSGLSWKE